MKLNPDCIRDILLTVESLPNMQHFYRFDKETMPILLPNYSIDEVQYHIRQCDLNGYLYQVSHFQNGDYTVCDLTPKGHDFLANIRSDTIWNDVKEISAKVGTKSISALSQIATGVITALIQHQLGI